MVGFEPVLYGVIVCGLVALEAIELPSEPVQEKAVGVGTVPAPPPTDPSRHQAAECHFRQWPAETRGHRLDQRTPHAEPNFAARRHTGLFAALR